MIHNSAIWLTAATVLWHAVVGCCAHHDHACAAESHSITAAPHQEHEHSCHCSSSPADRGHDHGDPATVCELCCDEHSPCGPCTGERCTLTVAKIKAEDFDAAATNRLCVVSAAPILIGTASAVHDFASVMDDRPPPLRAHLALHVLLI